MEASLPPQLTPHQQQQHPVPFVPCVEDSAHTRRVGRHPAAFQRTLDAVAYCFLTASARLARNSTAAAGPWCATTSSCRGVFAATLADNYAQLWQQRWLVPQASRREWYETVLVHLEALDALAVSLVWLTDAEGSGHGTHDVAHATTTITDATMRSSTTSSPDGPRKAIKKKAAQDTHPLWYLWQDTPHHLHNMTLRLRAWTPAASGAYATRTAMRLADLVHMDSAAFGWRVRQWCSVADLIATHAPTDGHDDDDSGSSSKKAVHAGFVDEVARRLRAGLDANAAATPNLGTFVAEEPELARLLLHTLCPSPAAATEGGIDVLHGLLQRRVAGALVYRMLLEVALGRLRALPRCPFTWRLLADVLSHVRPEGACAVTAAAAVPWLVTYITSVVLPYLESRDCHLGGMRHTAPEVHAHFTRLALVQMAQLCTAALGPDALAEVAHDSEQPGRLRAPLRRAVAMRAELFLRRACLGPEEVEASAGAARATPPDAQALISAALLDNVDAVCADKGEGIDEEREQVPEDTPLPVLPDGVTDAMRCDFRRKAVDEGVLHSTAARVAQLRLFLFHFFTQCPTLAFDRVAAATGDGEAAGAAAAA